MSELYLLQRYSQDKPDKRESRLEYFKDSATASKEGLKWAGTRKSCLCALIDEKLARRLHPSIKIKI